MASSGFPPEGEGLPGPVIDTHTHFPHGPDETVSHGVEPLPIDVQLERAARANVVGMIHSGCDLPGLQAAIDLARAHGPIAAAIAIHPNEAAHHARVTDIGPDGWEPTFAPHHDLPLDDAITRVADLAAAKRDVVVAIGETGLDYFRTAGRGRDVQRDAFRAHIALAKELDLPLQIHDRDAHADVLDVLVRDGAPATTVFHCFSGDAALAGVLNEYGWYASFAGPLTFKANDALREACRVMDPALVLVETDAPYLTPVPFRGRPNAPYLMTHTVRMVAEVRAMELAEACRLLFANNRRAYSWP